MPFTPVARGVLQRKCACGTHIMGGGQCAECQKKKLGVDGKPLQAKLAISEPGDAYEQEADRVAEQVIQMLPADVSKRQNRRAAQEMVQRRATGSATGLAVAPPSVHSVLRSPGWPLQPALQEEMGHRFGYDFSNVRVHTGAAAEQSARDVNAHAYTVGSNIVFGTGQFAPERQKGQRLLAHELAHVVQQTMSFPGKAVVQRQGDDADLVAEREYGDKGAPKAQKCGRPSWCPPGFCDPYRSAPLAEYYRSKQAWWIMAGISAAVDSRVVPLWREYLWGGSSPKTLTADFGADFTNSPTTKKTTGFLYDELKKRLAAVPPAVPLYSTSVLDLATLIPAALADLSDPASKNQMNFNVPKDIPGNLAGGIGKDQAACQAGNQPSPFNDDRKASGKVSITRLSASELTVTPIINYTVKDTIDLCPGDCGTLLEQVATVPLSQFEATGISGDVPFSVDFPAPFLGQFTIAASIPSSSPLPPKASKSP